MPLQREWGACPQMNALAFAFSASTLAPQLPNHAWMHRLASRDAAVARAFAAAALPRPQRQLVEGALVKPKIPKQWRAEANMSVIVNGKDNSPEQDILAIVPSFYGGIMYSDALAKRSIYISSQRFPFAPAALQGTGKDFMNFSILATSNLSGVVFNGETLDSSSAGGQTFSNIFAWLPAAQDGGVETVDGTALQAWAFKNGNYSFQLLVNATDTPVRLDINVTDLDIRLQYT